MADTILVTGTLDIDPANRDAAIEAIGTLMTATRAEEGCEQYVFSADLDDPGRFHISERWASQAAMDAHMGSAHMADFMGAAGGLGIKGSSLTKWTGATPEKLM